MEPSIALLVAALISGLVAGYLAARGRFTPRLAAANADIQHLNDKREREQRAAKELADASAKAFNAKAAECNKLAADLGAVKIARDTANSQLTTVRRERDEALAREKDAVERANSLQQTLTNERTERAKKPEGREVLRPAYGKGAKSTAGADLAGKQPPAAAPSTDPLTEQVKAYLGPLTEIESEKLANKMAAHPSTKLKGNALRIELKRIMGALGFEQLRGVQRAGRKAKIRVWRKKK